MDEAIFEVREIIISLCAHPGCPEWARWEISLLGDRDGWRVCSRHKRWAKTLLTRGPVPAHGAGGEGER